MFRKLLRSIRPSPQPSRKLERAMAETDQALERLRYRRELPTIPEIHVHIQNENNQEQPKKRMPMWVRILLAVTGGGGLLELIHVLTS